MIILGLTGSIAMGKSTVGTMFERLGASIFDADHAVHELMGRGGAAVEKVEEQFPMAIKGDEIDREMLGRIVYNNKGELSKLEGILHPMVREKEREFIHHCIRQRKPLVILEIPLLFEVNADRRCDATVVVSAPTFIQTQRVLRREGMNEQKLWKIRDRQMPDKEKRKRADHIINTGGSKGDTFRQVKRLVNHFTGQQGGKWKDHVYLRG